MDVELSFRDYFVIVKRRILFFVIPAALILPIGVALAILLPPVYQATGTILVESQQVPQDLVRSTVTSFADERIQFIRQKVMTRQTLLDISEKYGIFQGKDRPDSLSEVVDEMRSRVDIEILSADLKPGRQHNRATIAFTISYSDRDAGRALRVTNEFVTLFLNENVKSRIQRASETTDFLAQEAKRLRKKLESTERELATYKQENSNALPENLNLHLGMLERARQDQEKAEREIAGLEQELRFLDMQRMSYGADQLSNNVVSRTPAEELAALRTKLVALRAVYGDSHPDVRSIRRRIAAFEHELDPSYRRAELEKKLTAAKARLADAADDATASQSAKAEVAQLNADIAALDTLQDGNAVAASGDPIAGHVATQIAATKAQIASLTKYRDKVVASINDLEARIAQTPQVERGLTALQRNYENILKKYDETQAKKFEAQMAENLEEDQMAERFILLEPPHLPEKPVSPNRPKIIVLSLFLALAGGAGSVMFAEAVNSSITSAEQLAQVLKDSPIATIPYIVTTGQQRRRRQILHRMVLAVPVILIAILSGIHFLYMPLDIVLHKIIALF